MSAINKLLNPEPAHKTSDSEFETPQKSDQHETDFSESSPRKKVKLCKDAAIFTHGPVVGRCRFPPQEYQDELLSAKHAEFQLYPMGRIADYPRHIPYSSEKKSFLLKTGRDSLEVFQYQFKMPGSDTTYSMLWDYNIGLVRTTPLFKCTGHSKTTPAKMLNRNPGLREICHSITGGALVAQGYWMPFEAAKAIAATFCWPIRYALTPVFGPDFPDVCLPPDHPKHGDMTIDPSITKKCAAEALAYRGLQEDATSHNSTATPTSSPVISETAMSSTSKTLTTRYTRACNSTHNSDTPLGDSEGMTTPETVHRNVWRAVNTPHSAAPASILFTSSVDQSNSHNLNKHGNMQQTVSPLPGCTETDDGYDGDSSSTENSSQHVREARHTSEELEVVSIISSMRFHGHNGMVNPSADERSGPPLSKQK